MCKLIPTFTHNVSRQGRHTEMDDDISIDIDDYQFNTNINIGDTIQYNTGHQYSDEGQRIEAKVTAKSDDGFWLTVAFNDLDRGISGTMETCGFTESHIMELYNKNQYLEISLNTYLMSC